MNQHSMVECSHDYETYRDVTMMAFNQSGVRNPTMLQHHLVVKEGSTLTKLKVLAVPVIPRVVADIVRVPDLWKGRLNVKEVCTKGMVCDLLIGMDRGDLQPRFISHVDFEGEILSMWISHLTGSFLIGGKSAQNLRFERGSLGVNVVQVVAEAHPPLAQILPPPPGFEAEIQAILFDAFNENEPSSDESESDEGDSCDSGGETTDTDIRPTSNDVRTGFTDEEDIPTDDEFV